MNSALRRMLAHGILLFGLLAAPAMGITPEEARRQTEAARNHLNHVERQLRDAQNDVERVRRDLDDAHRRQQQLPRQIDQSRKEVGTLKDRIADAQKALPDLRSKISSANQQARQKQEAAGEAGKRVQAAQRTAEEMRDRLWQEFQAKPEYAAAAQALAAAQKRLDDASAVCLERLAKTPAFQQALAESGRKETEVKALRGAGDQSQLAEASTQWMRSKNAVEDQKQAALAADVTVQSARSEVQSASQAVAALKSRFEREVRSDPQMSPLLGTLESEKKSAAQAQGEFKSAQAAADSAERSLKSKESEHSSAKSRLDQEERELSRMQRQLTDADQDIREAQRRLDREQDDVQRLRRDRDRAADNLRDKQQQEDRARRNAKK